MPVNPGTTTGLGGLQRDPKQDVRTRRALAKLGGTTLVIDNESITVNDDGRMQAGLNGIIQVDHGGTGVSSFVPFEVITAGPTPTAALQQVDYGVKFQVLQSFGPGAAPQMYDRGVVPGIMAAWDGFVDPPGWLPCDGALYPIASYPDLFAAIGYNYGGAGAFFQVPNFSGFPVPPSGFALLDAANVFTDDNTFHGHVAFGADSAVDADPLGFHPGTYYNVVTVEEEVTDLTATWVNGVNVFLDLDPSATPQTSNPTGVNVEVRTDPANAQDWTAGTFNSAIGVGATVDHQAGVFINSMIAGNFQALNSGAGSLSFLEGLACIVQNVDPAGSVFITYGVNMAVVCLAGEITTSYANKVVNQALGGLIDTAYGCWVQNLGAGGAITTSYGTFVESPSGVTGDNFAHWVADQSGWGGTNCYAFWYDSPGVYRIKFDGVMAYYNPNFTKYTPGAADYERVVQQWDLTHDVLEYGVEKGGTGTQRALRLFGAGVQVAASGAVGPDASAALQADSVTQGFLPPRVTTTQKNAISAPAEGLVVYDTTLHKLCVRGAAAWETITSI